MKSFQHGVGLIEVLVALVIFAIGVVGMAGLQLRTISMSIDSTQRSVVIAKSQDLADRIRSSGAAPRQYVGTYDSTLCPTLPQMYAQTPKLQKQPNAAYNRWRPLMCGMCFAPTVHALTEQVSMVMLGNGTL